METTGGVRATAQMKIGGYAKSHGFSRAVVALSVGLCDQYRYAQYRWTEPLTADEARALAAELLKAADAVDGTGRAIQADDLLR